MADVGSAPSICAVVAGPAALWVNTGSLYAMEFLGWSLNGLTIEELTFMAPIHTDEQGGEQGPPVDYQILGYQHRITAELAKFQDSVLQKLASRFNLNTSASLRGVGMLARCNSAAFRVLIKAPNFTRNYTSVVMPEPIELSPVGSLATRVRLGFVKDGTVGDTMWDSTITTP